MSGVDRDVVVIVHAESGPHDTVSLLARQPERDPEIIQAIVASGGIVGVDRDGASRVGWNKDFVAGVGIQSLAPNIVGKGDEEVGCGDG